MRQNFGNNGGGANGLMSQLAAEKKKTVMAVCLITLMAFMWVRVFKKKSPQSARAAMMTQQLSVEQSEAELKISFAALPKVAGRNDMLSRDFFAASMARGEGSKGFSLEVSLQISRSNGIPLQTNIKSPSC